jgi:hypothetical protein
LAGSASSASAIEINSKRVSGNRGSMANVAASFSSVCGEARRRNGTPRVTFSASAPAAEAITIGAFCSLSASAA